MVETGDARAARRVGRGSVAPAESALLGFAAVVAADLLCGCAQGIAWLVARIVGVA